MPEREACERRVYRLATLLTGHPQAAVGVVTVVVDAQPDLSRLDSSHMDRLTVLRSRDIRSGVITSELVPPRVAAALADLPQQQREAWVLSRVYRMDERETAKAMDCSLTAIQRHIEHADHAMARALSRSVKDGTEALRRYAMTLDVPPFHRAKQRRRRIVRRVARLAPAAVVIAVLITAILIVVMWASRLPTQNGTERGDLPLGPAERVPDDHE
jgi:hypothetical protein